MKKLLNMIKDNSEEIVCCFVAAGYIAVLIVVAAMCADTVAMANM